MQGQSALLQAKGKLQEEVERLQALVATQDQQLKLLAQQQKQQQQVALHNQHMLPGVPAVAALGELGRVPPYVTQRLQAAEEQLRQAQAVGTEMQQQIQSKDKALQGQSLTYGKLQG